MGVVFLFALLGGLAVILQGCGGDDDDNDKDKTPDEKPKRDLDIECDGDCTISRKCSDNKMTIKWDKCAGDLDDKKIDDKDCAEFDKLAGKNEEEMKAWKAEQCEEAGKAKDTENGNLVIRNVVCTPEGAEKPCTVKYTCDKTKGEVTVTHDGAGCTAPSPDKPTEDKTPDPCSNLLSEIDADESLKEGEKSDEDKKLCEEVMLSPSDNSQSGDVTPQVLKRDVKCQKKKECVIHIECDPSKAEGNTKYTSNEACTTKLDETKQDAKPNCGTFADLSDANDPDGTKKNAERAQLCKDAGEPEDADVQPADNSGSESAGDQPSQATVV